MKQLLILLLLSLIICCSEPDQHIGPLIGFSLDDVQLLDGPFKKAQLTDMHYILSMDPDRLLSPYLREAGLQPKAKSYPNWENTGLDGHIGGHYLTALSLMYAATGNEKLKERLDYMVDELARCQKKNGNGYIGGIPGGKSMWEEIAEGNIRAGRFSLNDKWVPLYNIHKIYAGLYDAHTIGGNAKAKKLLIQLMDWMLDITSNLSDEQIQEMLYSEHGGLNEVFAKTSELTGNKAYLDLAVKFSDHEILDPLLEKKDMLTGMHANTQIPKVIGFEQVARLNGDESWLAASDFFWDNVVNQRSISIGGNSVSEHFNPIDDFNGMVESVEGVETCNSYNMLKLSKDLFYEKQDAAYMDFVERVLYNHILSSQHPDGGFVYFTSMRPRHYRVYSQAHDGFWCCVGSGLENHGKYGEFIYAHDHQNIFVNLFIASKLSWKEKGLELIQQTTFPESNETEFTLNLENPIDLGLKIRYPGWASAGEIAIWVNDQKQEIEEGPSNYILLDRKWQNGDKVRVQLPLQLGVEYLPADSSWVSFKYGPIVLGAETDTTDLEGVWAGDSRMGHVARGPLYPLDKAPWLVANNDQELLGKVKPINEEALLFDPNELLYTSAYQGVRLKPFYQIHEARYMVYWPVVSEKEVEGKLEKLRVEEEKMLVLEAKTVDKVKTGQQQPESDHFIASEASWTGISHGDHWREARDWFSYQFTDRNKVAKNLRITYHAKDGNHQFDLLLNGKLLVRVKEEGNGNDGFYDVDYEIPNKFISNSDGKYEIKLQALEGESTGRIYHLRLIK
ncbi:glycoside hydrolase family 127 protein [Echinicola sp. CAU 1574]|uniref:Glycoside hydrolase family 127 protein n=1 Tax=Echinicola arenosa TaxID=2774144 RepID=A0ABR9AJI6_9BACT|nr:glycoside hydrolase family 127 protein [Echinicola arenosa]MBD8488984.1 glycoside hydrolase family 127 protein [Echinicola arenosa]